MQNGSIGEARTKSFLIDRFWLLERSVDIHGADFIIQRRLHEKNILDETPIRFGIVQAKYSQNGNTVHNINRDFIIDTKGNYRLEFFLLIHTGSEESKKIYLLSSTDIVERFPENDGVYNIVSNAVFASKRYEIQSKKLALDRIESSIQCAEFYKNRLYIFAQPTSGKPDFDAILPEYREEINQWYGTFPEIFKEQKRVAYNELLKIEQLHQYLKNIVESLDPIEIFFIAEKLRSDFGRSISIPDFFETDFFYNARNIKEMVADMRSDGVLDNYIILQSQLNDDLNNFAQSIPSNKLNKGSIHKIKLQYNSESFELFDVENLLFDSEPEIGDGFSIFNKAHQGEIIYSWKLGLSFITGNAIKMNEMCLIEIMNKIYALKYHEDEEFELCTAVPNKRFLLTIYNTC